MEYALEVSGLRKEYPGFTLRDVSFALPRGHIMGLIGPNGAGKTDVKITGAPNGEYFSRVEQPRGELVHYVKGNGKKNLVRSRVRTPTFTNIPPLVKMLTGCQLAGRSHYCFDHRSLHQLYGEVKSDDNSENGCNGCKEFILTPGNADVSCPPGKTNTGNPWTYRHRSRKLYHLPLLPA